MDLRSCSFGLLGSESSRGGVSRLLLVVPICASLPQARHLAKEEGSRGLSSSRPSSSVHTDDGRIYHTEAHIESIYDFVTWTFLSRAHC